MAITENSHVFPYHLGKFHLTPEHRSGQAVLAKTTHGRREQDVR